MQSKVCLCLFTLYMYPVMLFSQEKVDGNIYISARENIGIDELKEKILEILYKEI